MKIERGWRAQVISGNTLGNLPIQARTLTEPEFEAVFSDAYDSIANARRALRLFDMDV